MTDLRPLADIFARGVFRVPAYQRGYAWQPVHRQDLLQDLESLENLENGRRHFMGTVVLHHQGTIEAHATGRTFDKFDIVDGQQRLTTLVILLNELTRFLDDTGNEAARKSAREVRERYVRYRSEDEVISKLQLHGSANQFLHQFVLGDNTNSATPEVPAEENLLDARTEFRTYLTKRCKRAEEVPTSQGRRRFLLGLRRRIAEELGFVVHEVDNQAEVGIIFEVMNARGKDLTQLEMVKNYLLYVTSRLDSQQEIERLSAVINETWRKLLETFQTLGESDENRYLRYHWIIYPEAPESENPNDVSDVHRALKDTIDLRQLSRNELRRAVEDYTKSLRASRDSFRILVRPRPDAFEGAAKQREAAVRHVRAINRIDRPATVRPLGMILFRRFRDEPDRLTELLRLLEVFCFRTAAMEFYANKGRSRLYGLARRIARDEIDGHEAIRGQLVDAVQDICPDTRVRKSLSEPDRNFYKWSQLRFFLYEYERSLEADRRQQSRPEWREVVDRKLDQTIEHILPQGKNTLEVEYWNDRFSDEQWRSHRNRLGNLCLTDWNASYSNRGFEAKCGHGSRDPEEPVYRNSAWFQEQELVNYSEWTPEAIDKRHEHLVEFALERWSV